MSSSIPIRNIAKEDRPREKLFSRDVSSLTNAELLAILIGSGNKKNSAIEIAQHILFTLNHNVSELARITPMQLVKQYRGIGIAKAALIFAGMELGKRLQNEKSKNIRKIMSSSDSFLLFKETLAGLSYENFEIILINRGNQVLKKVKISEGGIAGTTVDPKKVFKIALDHQSSGIILGHNHPSGNLEPSPSDISLTKQLRTGAKLLDIQVLDHIIVGNNNYFSFADHGLL